MIFFGKIFFPLSGRLVSCAVIIFIKQDMNEWEIGYIIK